MELHFDECMCSGNILKDFAKFNKVSEYLQAVLDAYDALDKGDEEPWYALEVHPTCQLGYRDFNGEWCYIFKNMERQPLAQTYINRLKRRRVRFNNFVSDNLIITADGFEHECYFEWA